MNAYLGSHMEPDNKEQVKELQEAEDVSEDKENAKKPEESAEKKVDYLSYDVDLD